MNRKLRDKLILVATCLMLLWCIPSFGQVLKGSISGTAVDQNGAVVPGAQVKATNTGTSAVLTTTTDNSGSFRFNLIPAGEYKIEISAQHFKTAVQNGVAVSAGRDSGLGQIRLSVGEASTTVEVTADAPLIETTQAQVTNTFSGVALSSFAGIQENQGLDNLAVFVPGVSSARDNGFSNFNGGGGFSSNGLRGRNNDQQIDGQNNNDNSVAGPALFVTDSEFVAQYVLVTNQFGPEYGRNSGSVVNVITKSGTNAWHGSIFGAENNSILNSLTNFQKNPDICGTDPTTGGPGKDCLKEPPRSNNEFSGFTVGGPWIKNKLFFFGGFDNQIISQSNVFSSRNFTPTPAGLAALAACFPTGVQNQAVLAITKFGPFGISTGNPSVIGTPTNINPATTLPFVAGCPTATFAGVSRIVSQPVHNFDWIVKQDLQLGNDTITGRYIFNRGNSFNNGDNGAAGYFFNLPALSQAALISWTHNLSAHMVNEARVSFGRANIEFGGGFSTPAAQQLDQAITNVSFSAGGLLGYGPATNLPQQRIVNTWQAQDNWNWVLGKHQIKAGVNWTYQRSPNIFLPTINGAYRFGSWNSYFNNTPNRVRVAQGPSSLDFREYDTFLYGGDDWKITQNLTIQVGLTWSYYGQPANIFNDITTKRESNTATAFWRQDLPLSVRTLPTIPAPKNSFGPAVGFVYSPQWGGFLTGHGKTTFRGGYRMLYDPPFYNIYLNVATSAPEVFLQSVASPATHPLPAVPTGPNVRTALQSSLTPLVFDPRTFAQTNITPNFGPDKVHTWTFGFERELSKNSAFEARYVGNHATSLFQTVNANPFIADLVTDFPGLVPAGLTPCATSQLVGAGAAAAVGRANCAEGVVRTRTNTGYSNYHALQSEFRANNLFKQLTVRAAYTFSKTLDNVSEIFSTFGGGNTTFTSQNPANIKAPGEYAHSGLDYPHQASFIVTEQLPFFKEQHGAIGHILGGWALSGNYVIASGQNYTPAQLFAAGFTNTLDNPGIGSFGEQPVASKDYYDAGFFGNFNSGVEAVRPFLGSLSAPATSVGVFAADACSFEFGITPSTQVGSGFKMCGDTTIPGSIPGTTLINLTALQKALADPSFDPGTFTPATITAKDVRFIINGFTAQKVFGTPFGNSPRNPVRDEITNIANFSIIKNIKLGERANFEFHTTFLNVFNHPNFGSVDPFIEDAGFTGAFNGFGDVRQTNSTPRTIYFTGKITF